MLDVIDLNFDYSDKPLLNGVSFHLEPGSLLHLQGQNGAGKTTLLKLLAGLLRPSQGDIRYNGKSISQDLALYQHNLCYIGHRSGVSLALTVAENCSFDLQWSKKHLPIEAWLKRFGLRGLEQVSCGLLSAGQRKRVGLLRLLMSDASLWLLDEPLVALDQAGITALMDCLTAHLAGGGQVVLTSHQALPSQIGVYQDYLL